MSAHYRGYRGYLSPYMAEIITLRKAGVRYRHIAEHLFGRGLRSPAPYHEDREHQIATLSSGMRNAVERHCADEVYALPYKRVWRSGAWTPEKQALEIAAEAT